MAIALDDVPNPPSVCLKILPFTSAATAQDPHREIRRLADFLEIRCSDEVIAKVVANSSFSKMKRQADNSSFFRSGTVGDSARHFSLGLEAEFDTALREQMRGVADPYEK